jgi:murein DD-endopeptidase MepM/ murein hydrolase activator NlpD
MRRHLAAAVLMSILGGCADQAPAPLVNGYGHDMPQLGATTASAASTAGAFSQIEPAAGPVSAVASAPVANAYSTAPAVREDNLAPVGAAKATLPPPSVIGDMKNYSTNAKGWQSYQVQQGDTVYRLAREFNSNADEILKANHMESAADIAAGQTLTIPAGIGSFGKAGSLGTQTAQAATPAVAQAQAAPQQVAAAQTVTGPNGTRYSLTRHEEVAAAGSPGTLQVASNQSPAAKLNAAAKAALAQKATDIEPAAGPTPQQVKAQVHAATDAGQKVAYLDHQVESGETVYRIAQKYHASVIDIMNANEFNQPQDLKAGTIVKVPVPAGGNAVEAGPTRPMALKDEPQPVAEVASINPRAAIDVQAELQRGKIDPVAARAKGMVWPVKGKVSSEFGTQGPGVTNSGIAIKVPPNTPVLAVDDGVVVYADDGLRTYGNLVLLRHKNGLVTAYGHNNALLVKKGETVKKGQVIALSGNTGNVKDSQLHFEIRQNARAIDPLAMLPSR